MSDKTKEIIKNGIIAISIATTMLILIKPVIVKQTSMLPTLQENNYLFLSRQSYTFGDPQYGDIVVFPEPGGKDLFVKRVVGLPGDTIEIKNDKVYINGKQEKDTYTKDGKTEGPIIKEDESEVNKIKVPKGELFLMGDNRAESMDSREIGTIPIKKIIGKAKIRLWPLNKIQIFK